MSCNKPLTIELTCKQIAGVIHALGPHSGAEMNVVSKILGEKLEEHNENHS